MSVEYTTRDGEEVCVPMEMNPFEHLGILPSSSAVDTKYAVRRLVTGPERQERAMASLAYHMITSTGQQYQKSGNIYTVVNPDIFFFAAIGHREKVIEEIERNPDLVRSVDEYNRTAFYIATRSGFSDIVEILVRRGADMNCGQYDSSTPLHAAAFYGQEEIVKMLLVYGADPTLKNTHGGTPVNEASEELTQVFVDYQNNPFEVTVNFFSSLDVCESEYRRIEHRGKLIGVEIFRNVSKLDEFTMNEWEKIKTKWEVAYHGTKHRYIKSILTHGLLPSGATLPDGETVRPPPNHYQLGMRYAGVEDWARAVFVSPNILYASHPCYSEYVRHGNSQWCVVLKVFVDPSSYRSYNPTVLFKEQPIYGKPVSTEYRVGESTTEGAIFSILSHYMTGTEAEISRSVVVASIIFIDANFLTEARDFKFNRYDLRKLFC